MKKETDVMLMVSRPSLIYSFNSEICAVDINDSCQYKN